MGNKNRSQFFKSLVVYVLQMGVVCLSIGLSSVSGDSLGLVLAYCALALGLLIDGHIRIIKAVAGRLQDVRPGTDVVAGNGLFWIVQILFGGLPIIILAILPSAVQNLQYTKGFSVSDRKLES